MTGHAPDFCMLMVSFIQIVLVYKKNIFFVLFNKGWRQYGYEKNIFYLI